MTINYPLKKLSGEEIHDILTYSRKSTDFNQASHQRAIYRTISKYINNERDLFSWSCLVIRVREIDGEGEGERKEERERKREKGRGGEQTENTANPPREEGRAHERDVRAGQGDAFKPGSRRSDRRHCTHAGSFPLDFALYVPLSCYTRYIRSRT